MRNWILMTVLMLLATLSALGVVYTQHVSRQLFIDMQALRTQEDELLTQFGQLQLEQSTWSTHGRVESIAHEKLNMRIPGISDVKMIYSAADEEL